MLTLGLDSSTQIGNLSLVQNEKVLSYIESPELKKHSDHFNKFLDTILEENSLKISDVDVIVVGNGPGSFTGIRVAGNIAKTISFLTKKPLVQMNSLYSLGLYPKSANAYVLSALNAYKNLIYFGVYLDKKEILAPSVKTPAQIEKFCLENLSGNTLFGIGDGFKVYSDLFSASFLKKITSVEAEFNYPRSDLMCLDYQSGPERHPTIDWNLYSPLYLRASEAEENLVKKLS